MTTAVRDRALGALGALVGGVVGTLIGFFFTISIFVAKARAGIYVYSFDDVTAFRWEMAPTFIGLLLGATLAWGRLGAFLRGVGLALAASLAAVPFGWFLGPWLQDGRSAAWAWAVLAAALGLLAGLVTAIARGYPLRVTARPRGGG